MQWTSFLAAMALLIAVSEGFFFGTTAPVRRRDRPPIGRRRATWQPRPYWDWTWNRPYSAPPTTSLRRFHQSRLHDYNSYNRRDSYYNGGNSYQPAATPYNPVNAFYQSATRTTYQAGNSYNGGNTYSPPTTRTSYNYAQSSYNAQPSYPRPVVTPGDQFAGRRTEPSAIVGPGAPLPLPSEEFAGQGSNPQPERVPPPPAIVNASVIVQPSPQISSIDENITEEEKAHNYMRNTELLVKIATHFDTYGCFRRLVCECEYYSTRLSPSSRTLEEKLILHVFGMDRRRKEGDMDSARFYQAAATGESARRQGLPDPCPAMAPKCPDNMVKKLWTRHAAGTS